MRASGRYASSVRTLLPDPPPADIEALLDRRRRIGADRSDEVWEGVLHMAPAPADRHALIAGQVPAVLMPLAEAAGLAISGEFNLGLEEDYRVPDGGLHHSGGWGTYAATAALVVEIVSPGDETWEKLPFYAAHGVEEVVIIDPGERHVDWLALHEEKYLPAERSALIAFGPAQLGEQLDWPA